MKHLLLLLLLSFNVHADNCKVKITDATSVTPKINVSNDVLDFLDDMSYSSSERYSVYESGYEISYYISMRTAGFFLRMHKLEIEPNGDVYRQRITEAVVKKSPGAWARVNKIFLENLKNELAECIKN